jgi:hypothetical protein
VVCPPQPSKVQLGYRTLTGTSGFSLMVFLLRKGRMTLSILMCISPAQVGSRLSSALIGPVADELVAARSDQFGAPMGSVKLSAVRASHRASANPAVPPSVP